MEGVCFRPMLLSYTACGNGRAVYLLSICQSLAAWDYWVQEMCRAQVRDWTIALRQLGLIST